LKIGECFNGLSKFKITASFASFERPPSVPSSNIVVASVGQEMSMRAEILLKHDEKERLLASASLESPARSVLDRAVPKRNQPHFVTISCDEQVAAAILRIAHPHHGSTWRVMHKQMKRLGLLKSILNAR
jgi:hypothetical protein